MPTEERGGEVVPIQQNVGITKMQRGAYDPQQVALIKQTVAKDCTDAELAMLLELAARYELDPFARQIWAAKLQGQSGPVSIIVARDGLLKIADRYPDYRGTEGQPVYQGDDFHTTVGDEGIEVHHKTAPIAERGELLGAWARVHRDGRRPTYFFAPLSEYKPTGRKLEVSPWSRQQSAMILKCAESMALRKAFSVSGIVGEEEVARQQHELTAPPDVYGDDPLNQEIKTVVEAANEMVPGAFREAKVRARIRGASEDQRHEFLDEVKAFIQEQIEKGVEVTPESVEDPPAA